MAAISEDVFDVLVCEYGSGWKALHVSINKLFEPPGKEGSICLTLEATSHDEFERDVDELISQLERLKVKGRRELMKILNQQ